MNFYERMILVALTREVKLDLLRTLLNLTSDSTNANISVDLPGIDVDVSIPVTVPLPTPSSPSLRNTLLGKLDEEITVDTTSGEEVTGTLVAVQTDYIVLVGNDGTLSFVRIAKIETVQETSF